MGLSLTTPFSTKELTNVENATSNFRQFVQICCREEKRDYWQLQRFLRSMQTQKRAVYLLVELKFLLIIKLDQEIIDLH